MVPARRTVHLIIAGRVQGVWYRGWTVDQARARALDGWVRNLRDGTVEAVLSGAPEDVAVVIEACYRGPPAARVDHIDISEQNEPPASGFLQLPTA
jgi:acylphosphatase